MAGLHRFLQPTDGLEPPARFTFPFYYEPHPLALLAVEQLQNHLRTQTDWDFPFGDDTTNAPDNQGKMFGVLVVRDAQQELGFLAAFSGKLADTYHLPGFAPPVYNLLAEDGYYRQEEQHVNAMNARIAALENAPELAAARTALQELEIRCATEIEAERAAVREARSERKQKRAAAEGKLSPAELEALEKELGRESVTRHFALKDLRKACDRQLELAQAHLASFTDQIKALKEQRREMSNTLQGWIFGQYRFLAANGEVADLKDIFKDSIFGVPAGAGECAAPKLLQHAYLNGWEPVALAEFWWGQSPSSEIRQHLQFYPACRGKCEPILGHMLKGLEVDPNPMLVNPAAGKDVEIIYEDATLAVVAKPEGFLSVPGRHIADSVQARMKKRYPESDSPLIVHRLDMSTSGLLLIPKTREAHKHLQRQFAKRTIKKRYVALVDGVVMGEAGTITLPLRGDLEDRPRQIVCHQHGKFSQTRWQVIQRRADGTTLVHFWPLTGRTHQLRVHAAHPAGLNAPIVGDDLYGAKAERLCLHAEWIEFVHPVSKETVDFIVEIAF